MQYSYIYTLPYIIILLILYYLYRREQNHKRFAKQGAFLLLLFFIGLRGFVASDYASYYPFFEELPTLSKLEFNSLYSEGFEFGFIFYSSIIKTIYPDFFFWVFINTLVDLSVFYWLFQRFSFSVVLSFIIFFAIQGLGIEFNLYRNTKAMALFLLSIPYLKERKLLPYILLNLGGCLFHLTSFLYLPLYFILTKKIPKILIWSGFFVVNIMFFLHISMTGWLVELIAPLLGIERMADKVVNYLSNAENYNFSIGYIERTLAFILFACLNKQLYVQSEYNRIFSNCFVLYYLSFYMFTDVMVLAERVSVLFIFSYWILYPNTLQLIKRPLNRQLFLTYIILLCVMKTFTAHSNIMSMYDNLLWGIRSFEERMEIFQTYMTD